MVVDAGQKKRIKCSKPATMDGARLERLVKGFANHRRIAMLQLLDEQPELSLTEISERLEVELKTASEHLRRLAIAGLVMKRYQNREVRHKLTPRAKKVLKFLKRLK